MKSILIPICAVAFIAIALQAGPQDQKKSGSPETRGEIAAGPAGQQGTPAREQLEAKFKSTLTRATMTGRWCAIKDGQLSAEKDDKYTIVSVVKSGGDAWVINARMQYNKKEIVAPIPVLVQWAGDTAVIIVDRLTVPGGGTYSARVLVYENTYAGTWSGGDHGGLLHGIITNEKD